MGEPLAGLDGIDWAGLDHAYGSAEDVPGLLRALSSSDEEKREAAVGELFTNIFHQGSRYGASAAAVPFLVALAADPDTPERTWPLYLASALAIGYDEAHLPSGVDITAWREETARLRVTEPAAEKQRLDAWVAEAANEQERLYREAERDHFDFARVLRLIEADLAAYDAVRAALPTVRSLLGDDDAEVRAAAAYTAGWFPEEASATLPALEALLDAEQDPTVIAHALIAAGLLTNETPPAQSRDHLTTAAAPGEQTPHAQTRDRLTVVRPAGGSMALARSREDLVVGLAGGRGLLSRCREHLAAPEPLPRWAAAIVLARLGAADAAVIAELAASSASPPEGEAAFLEGDLRLYSALALASLDEVPPDAVDAVLSGLSRTDGDASFPMAEAALRLTFRVPLLPLPRFADLAPAQQRTVRTIAELPPESWRWGNLLEVVRAWGLPTVHDECRRYAGLA
ncbi:HEAT repeat domain-containing protein [Actinomadura luteofluorescens]|uniref:HEAT repeat domain-containing protein n=1 Tax=Actinomadura luteofluorescens TaxID=46163 RepID=UPI0030CEB8FE